jgi:hypothetical protein
MKKSTLHQLLVLAGVAWLGTTGSPALAQAPGAHPHYVHALSDLREAHAVLSSFHTPTGSDPAWSDKEVRFAMRECLRAAWDDGKNTNDNFAPDVRQSHRDLMRQARTLLEGARRDLKVEEDNPNAYSWRNDALSHLNKAIQYLDRAIRTAGQ